MECINFDRAFEQYATQWMKANAARYGNNVDKMEARMPDVYMRWLNAPAKWLGGLAPAAYFAQHSDPAMLLDWMVQYEQQNVPVPALLMERLADVEGAEAVLLKALEAVDTPYGARLTVVSLLRELDCQKPMELYIRWIAQRGKEDELADLAAESLVSMGSEVAPAVLEAMENASPAGKETFLDVLCNFPGDERVVNLALGMFAAKGHHKALIASYLCKLGDPRAIEPLRAAAVKKEINYLDYIEIRNAIEALGGDAPPERDFTGDPFYESMRGVEGLA